HFNPQEISRRLDEIHEIERMADDKKHELTDKLAKAFITPIEREDIVELSHHIDDVTDKVEEVLIRIYINNVQKIPQEALQLLDVVCQCCEEVQNLLKEFSDFRHSNKITQKIIAINTLEEEADSLYKIGRASCRERVCIYMRAVSLKKIIKVDSRVFCT